MTPLFDGSSSYDYSIVRIESPLHRKQQIFVKFRLILELFDEKKRISNFFFEIFRNFKISNSKKNYIQKMALNFQLIR